MPRHSIAKNWYPKSLINRVSSSPEVQDILTETGSITQRLRLQCPDLTVQILDEQWALPLIQERLALDLPAAQKAWIRTVKLKCQQQTLLYARTVIPNCVAGNPWFALKQLGAKPLGEVLFQQQKLSRTEFKFACLKRQPLPKLEASHAYGRQSCFYKNQQPLLLTEVFFDDVNYSL